MQEIWIPLALIFLFLFFHIMRPYVKRYRSIEGFAWLPLLAFLGALALIPAYGFRPETIPLLLYSAVLTLISITKQINGEAKFKSYRKKKFVFVFLPMLLLFAAGAAAFYFTPERVPVPNDLGVYSFKENEYSIRIYTDDDDRMPQRRPLLVILPPALGSLPVIEETIGELRNNGFTVLSYTKLRRTASIEWFRYIRAYISGAVSAGANAAGRAIEEERKQDALFLLSWVRRNPGIPGMLQRPPSGKGNLFDIASVDAIFFAGYDAGGSAVILLENSFPADIKIRGLIAIESPLWSAYREEAGVIPDIPADAGWFDSVKFGLNRWFLEIKPKKIAGLEGIPKLSIPVLFLVSDRKREPKYSRRYLALNEYFKAAQGSAVISSVDGAGPLDYSDFPVRYPIITTVLRGFRKSAWNNTELPSVTASIIADFAASAMGAGSDSEYAFKNTPLKGGIQIDAK